MEKTLRDELAMSMPFEAIPILENEDAILDFMEANNLEVNLNIQSELIEFALTYQSIIRYKYADAMLKERNKTC